jgi:hypothetical protein
MVLRRSALMLSVGLLSACANNTVLYNPPAQRMSTEDLNYFKTDCAHAAEQKAFLENQLRYIPAWETSTPDRGIVLMLLGRLKTYCPQTTEVRAVGCTHIREDMTSGSAQAVVCNSDPHHGLRPTEAPIVNRWDPLVDTK